MSTSLRANGAFWYPNDIFPAVTDPFPGLPPAPADRLHRIKAEYEDHVSGAMGDQMANTNNGRKQSRMIFRWARDTLHYAENYAGVDKGLVQVALDIVCLVASNVNRYQSAALYIQGLWHLFGLFGHPRDLDISLKLFLESGKLGYSRALYRIGSYYELVGQPDVALTYFEHGVKRNDSACNYRLAMAYLRGHFGKALDISLGMRYLERSSLTSDPDCPQSSYVYALIQMNEFPGLTLESHNPESGLMAMERAAWLDFGPALTKMGKAWQGGGKGFDASVALRYFQLASIQQQYALYKAQVGETEPEDQPADGVPEVEMAKWFLCGSVDCNLDINEEWAFRFSSLAAECHNVTGEFAVAYCYEVGIYVTPDLDFAKQWYVRAADNGSEDAKRRLESLENKESKAEAGATEEATSTPIVTIRRALTRKDHERTLSLKGRGSIKSTRVAKLRDDQVAKPVSVSEESTSILETMVNASKNWFLYPAKEAINEKGGSKESEHTQDSKQEQSSTATEKNVKVGEEDAVKESQTTTSGTEQSSQPEKLSEIGYISSEVTEGCNVSASDKSHESPAPGAGRLRIANDTEDVANTTSYHMDRLLLSATSTVQKLNTDESATLQEVPSNSPTGPELAKKVSTTSLHVESGIDALSEPLKTLKVSSEPVASNISLTSGDGTTVPSSQPLPSNVPEGSEDKSSTARADENGSNISPVATRRSALQNKPDLSPQVHSPYPDPLRNRSPSPVRGRHKHSRSIAAGQVITPKRGTRQVSSPVRSGIVPTSGTSTPSLQTPTKLGNLQDLSPSHHDFSAATNPLNVRKSASVSPERNTPERSRPTSAMSGSYSPVRTPSPSKDTELKKSRRISSASTYSASNIARQLKGVFKRGHSKNSSSTSDIQFSPSNDGSDLSDFEGTNLSAYATAPLKLRSSQSSLISNSSTISSSGSVSGYRTPSRSPVRQSPSRSALKTIPEPGPHLLEEDESAFSSVSRPVSPERKPRLQSRLSSTSILPAQNVTPAQKSPGVDSSASMFSRQSTMSSSTTVDSSLAGESVSTAPFSVTAIVKDEAAKEPSQGHLLKNGYAMTFEEMGIPNHVEDSKDCVIM